MKNTIATFAMMIVMATFANAGIMVSDRPSGQCTQGTGILVGGRPGIMVSDRSGILSAIADIIIGMTEPGQCSTADRDGILVGG